VLPIIVSIHNKARSLGGHSAEWKEINCKRNNSRTVNNARENDLPLKSEHHGFLVIIAFLGSGGGGG